MGNGESKEKGAKKERKQKGTAAEASDKGEYSPDEFQMVVFDSKIFIEEAGAMETRLEEEITNMKKMVYGFMKSKPPKKDRAVFTMKLVNMKQKQLTNVRNRILHTQKLLDTVYETKEQKEFVENLRQSNATLRALKEGITVDTVQALMDENRELQEVQDEMNTIIGDSVGAIDESNVLSEVDALLEDYADLILEPEPGELDDAEPTAQKPLPAAQTDDGSLEDLPEAPTDTPELPQSAGGEATQTTDLEDLPEAPDHVPLVEEDAGRTTTTANAGKTVEEERVAVAN